MGQITPEVYQYMVDQFGEEKTRQWLKEDGNEVPNGFAAQSPTSTVQPAAVAEKTPVQPENDLSVEALTRNMLQQQQVVAAQRTKRFEQVAADLAKQRSGPSLSERLYQLSAAFASPVPVHGSRFSGVMANVMPVLAKQHEATRTGRTLDKEKLRTLQEKYDDANAGDVSAGLQYQLALAKLRDDQKKAMQPKVAQNPVTGEPTLLPSYEGLAKPQNEAELSRLRPGTPFIMWEGPYAGTITTKTQP